MFMFSVSYIVYFLFIVDFWDAFGTGLEEGDQCLFKDGTLGTCKFLTSCQPALESLQIGIFPQNVCGFRGTKSIFCCNTTDPVPTKIPEEIDKHNAVPGEISKKMCKKYIEFVPDSYECPFYADLTDGNSFASRQEFPHMVMLGYRNEVRPLWLCGGSLISEQFVLVTAYCLFDDSNWGPPVVARIGVTNLNDTDHLQDIKIKELIVHPEFIRPDYNDIGLVRLEKNVVINSYARPACLFTEKELIRNAISTGWGAIEDRGEFDTRLQKVTLEIYTEEHCNGVLYGSMICVGTRGFTPGQNETEEIKSRQPASGGPLQVLHKEVGTHTKCISDILGVVTFGKNLPSKYTRVSAFIPWIEENVWN